MWRTGTTGKEVMDVEYWAGESTWIMATPVNPDVRGAPRHPREWFVTGRGREEVRVEPAAA
jgi:hypothetical protein